MHTRGAAAALPGPVPALEAVSDAHRERATRVQFQISNLFGLTSVPLSLTDPSGKSPWVDVECSKGLSEGDFFFSLTPVSCAAVLEFTIVFKKKIKIKQKI